MSSENGNKQESGTAKLSKMAALLNRNRKTQIKETHVEATSSTTSEITPEMRAASLATFWGPGKSANSTGSNGKQSGGKSANGDIPEEESEIDREIRERREALLSERIKRAKAAILREAEREKGNGRLEMKPNPNKEFLSRTLGSIVSSDRREEQRREKAREDYHEKEREKEHVVLQRLRDREKKEVRKAERKSRDTSKERRDKRIDKSSRRSRSRSRSVEIISNTSKIDKKDKEERKDKESKQKKKEHRKNRSRSRSQDDRESKKSKKKHKKEKSKRRGD